MQFFKNLFGSKPKKETLSNVEFWEWFKQHEADFSNVIKSHSNVEEGFLNKFHPKLKQVNKSLFFLAGPYDDNTIELIITPDGSVSNIVFAEELIAAAPAIPNWKFTALKPEWKSGGEVMKMDEFTFSQDNLSFYANENPETPDLIDIHIVCDDFSADDKNTISNGVAIFLDNYLGELNHVTLIDKLAAIPRSSTTQELIPLSKLKDYLIWRQKEFVEKYEGTRRDTENDTYSSIQGKDNKQNPIVGIFNTTLMQWEGKASHPWVMSIEITYKGNDSGMPDNNTLEELNRIEDEITDALKDVDGYLNVGRLTSSNTRDTYFACKEFRKPSKVLKQIQEKYSKQYPIEYFIFKDKYWNSMYMFNPQQ